MNGGVPRSSLGAYNVTNQADVLALLKLVRTSGLDPESKDAVRDLLFAIDTENVQQTVGALMVHLDSLSVEITAESNTTFSPTVAPAADVTPAQVDTPAVVTQARFAAARPVPTFAPVAAQSVPAAVAPAAMQEPAVEVTESATTVQPVATQTETSENHATSPVATPTSTAAAADPMTRIKEIKKIINDQVGNPAHLIDTTNDIGRAYMNALLTAMKAVSGEGNTESAMTALEIAFEAVQKSLAAHQAAEPVVTKEKEPTVESVTEKSASDVVPAPFVATPETNQVVPTPAVDPAPPIEPAEAETVPAAKAATPTPAPTNPTVVPSPTVKPAPVADVVAPAAGLRSLADARQTQNEAAEATKPAEPVVTKPQNPLESDLVDNGLSQLLKEWSLFKSSGLLGTGAKGAEHPLYKELRNMPMNMVIAGRFEGATPEVRQSITDYMNGWRYEQGMTHDMQETFEHYLRRVVKTIIDKQAK